MVNTMLKLMHTRLDKRFNGKFQENQVVGLMVLDERMSGMPVKRIAGCKIILRD